MRYIGYICLAAVVAVGGLAAWYNGDLGANYVPVTAIVTSRSVLCHLQRGNQRVVDRLTHETIEVPCNIAEAAVQPGQPRAGYTVKSATTLTYRYISPVNEAWYTGQAQRQGPADAWPKPGSHIRVYAHKKEAETSKFVG